MRIINLLFLIILISCSQNSGGQINTDPLRGEVIKLNQEAADIISENMMNETVISETAMNLLDRAVEIDSTYIHSYLNKATVYRYENDYESSLKQYLEAVKYEKSRPDLYVTIGLNYAKLNDSINYALNIRTALSRYDSLISHYPDSIDLKVNRLYPLLFIESADQVQLEFSKVKALVEEEKAEVLEDFITSFNKQAMIRDF